LLNLRQKFVQKHEEKTKRYQIAFDRQEQQRKVVKEAIENMKMTQEFYRGKLDTYFDKEYGDITKMDFLAEGSVTEEDSIKEIPLEM